MLEILTMSFADLAISDELREPLLNYLNLPPGCCYADDLDVFDTADERCYELTKKQRQAILFYREQCGGKFSFFSDLRALHQVEPRLLSEIAERLKNVERYGNSASSFWGGANTLAAYLELLNQATKYIHISTYILGGKVGLEIVRLLEQKMRQGVEVRIIFCASGLVLSGSPSGSGVVSRFSSLRSFLLNDLYARKAILALIKEKNIPFVDSSPIGFHWRRRTMKQKGIDTKQKYYSWVCKNEFPQMWVDEQRAIDAECKIGFANVDHRKITIVDGTKAFIGSQNLSDSYFYENQLDRDPVINRKNWQWHDASYIVSGGCVHQLSDLFACRWWLSGGDRFDYRSSFYRPPPGRVGNACVTTVTTIPGLVSLPWRKNLKGFLRTMIGCRSPVSTSGWNPVRERLKMLPSLAQEKMYVEHCYVSDSELLEEWSAVADKPLCFKMIVPKHYDVFFLGRECNTFYPGLVASGIRVFLYQKAILHTKMTLIDGFYTFVGSYNLNLRSARSDLECVSFIQCDKLGKEIEKQFDNDLNSSVEISLPPTDKKVSRPAIPFIDAFLRYFIF